MVSCLQEQARHVKVASYTYGNHRVAPGRSTQARSNPRQKSRGAPEEQQRIIMSRGRSSPVSPDGSLTKTQFAKDNSRVDSRFAFGTGDGSRSFLRQPYAISELRMQLELGNQGSSGGRNGVLRNTALVNGLRTQDSKTDSSAHQPRLEKRQHVYANKASVAPAAPGARMGVSPAGRGSGIVQTTPLDSGLAHAALASGASLGDSATKVRSTSMSPAQRSGNFYRANESAASTQAGLQQMNVNLPACRMDNGANYSVPMAMGMTQDREDTFSIR